MPQFFNYLLIYSQVFKNIYFSKKYFLHIFFAYKITDILKANGIIKIFALFKIYTFNSPIKFR
jgi:hypothetical protein